MKITCNNCEDVIQGYLCDLPSEWRKQIAYVICKFLNPATSISCSDVKKCETLTSLSAFSVNGNEICIDYKDENGVTVHRCFNIAQIGLTLDPKCIMSQQAWDALTWEEQIQAIIDYACSCHSNGCACFTLTNDEVGNGVDPYVFTYVDCDDNIQHDIPLGFGESISFCANENIPFYTNFAFTVVNNGICDSPECSTTTTTTLP